MDNAQKAIMIGVGLFITIIIISAVLLITNLGTGLINNAQGQMSNISTAVQNQITGSYDGKTMTGSDVISAVQLYQNSNDISVRIVVGGGATGKQYQTGKYAVTLLETDSGAYQSAQAGGKKCKAGTTNGAYDELKSTTKASLSDIQEVGGVSATQTYYSYVLRDEASDTAMGILFVRKGIADNTTINATVAAQ